MQVTHWDALGKRAGHTPPTMPRTKNQQQRRWHAIGQRVTLADDAFIYGVRTTGIFCRPTCASRQPLRENVEFFDTMQAAQRAGYRACKRCKPEADSADGELRKMLTTACERLTQAETVTNAQLAATLELSVAYFQRCFKKHLGVTPQQYRRRALAERGRTALRGSASVVESIYAAGYSSSSRFYAGLGQELGMKPAVARTGGKGEVIQYALAQCSLGHLMIAWTVAGVCQVAFADAEHKLVEQLRLHFPHAQLQPSHHDEWTAAVVAAVEMAAPADLPLDMRGTAFQERVWQQLQAIAPGETRSYAEIARELGQPSAARAVAGACAANPLAVLVPCHRVVRADGELSGYRWGRARKRELLEREAQLPDAKRR